MTDYTFPEDICNKALQELGVARIVSLSDASRNAAECNFLYDKARQALLCEHVWLFAIKFVSLSGAPAKVLTYQNQQSRNGFTLPADYLRIADQNPRTAGTARQETTGAIKYTDYSVESGLLVTSLSAVILRYVFDATDVTTFHPLFCDTLAARMCVDGLAEVLTGSPQKRQLAMIRYSDRLQKARSISLIESGSDEPLPEEVHVSRMLEPVVPPIAGAPQR